MCNRPMLPRLPEALMRVAPNFGLRGSGADSSSSLQQQHQGINMPALTPLRQHMSLELSGQGQLELRAPSNVLQVRVAAGSLATGVRLGSTTCVESTQQSCVQRIACKSLSHHTPLRNVYATNTYLACRVLHCLGSNCCLMVARAAYLLMCWWQPPGST